MASQHVVLFYLLITFVTCLEHLHADSPLLLDTDAEVHILVHPDTDPPFNSVIHVSCSISVHVYVAFGHIPTSNRYSYVYQGDAFSINLDACLFYSGFDTLNHLYLSLLPSSNVECSFSYYTSYASFSNPPSESVTLNLPSGHRFYYKVDAHHLHSLTLKANNVSSLMVGQSCPLRSWTSISHCSSSPCVFSFNDVQSVWVAVESIENSIPSFDFSSEGDSPGNTCSFLFQLNYVFVVIMFLFCLTPTKYYQYTATVLCLFIIYGSFISGDLFTILVLLYIFYKRIVYFFTWDIELRYDIHRECLRIIIIAMVVTVLNMIVSFIFEFGYLLKFLNWSAICYEFNWFFVGTFIFESFFLSNLIGLSKEEDLDAHSIVRVRD
ncbi:hypothetical protein GEMRC1_002027 [Eukaryota sp. GEM-RC1]